MCRVSRRAGSAAFVGGARRVGGRRLRRVFPLLLVATMLTGCASGPAGSQVVGGRVTGHQQPIDDPYVRVIPVGPGHDWAPGKIITAIQAASGSFDGPFGVLL